MSEVINNSSNDTSLSEDFSVAFTSQADNDTVILTSQNTEEKINKMLSAALDTFDPSNRQYSTYLNEVYSTEQSEITPDDIAKLARGAQNNLQNILKINNIIRQFVNEDDIIGATYEAIEANLNSNVKISFDDIDLENVDKKVIEEVKRIIKNFHKEVNINQVLSSSIPMTYTEGTYIKYLRSKNGHYFIDSYPLGVAIVYDYNVNGIPYVLIDIRELTNRLQKTVIRGKKNKSLFFDNTTQEIKNNYPPEIYNAYINREHYAKLDLEHTGITRIFNMNRKYGLSPIFKALKPSIMLKTYDNADRINTRAKSKKIIHQVMRKETMGSNFEKKGYDEMAYAHSNLMEAWKNPTVVYTSPPSVEKIIYVEPKTENTNADSIQQLRSRITSALGISFLNTDGKQTISTANISIKQLMKTINKMAKQEEIILKRWYSIVLRDNGIDDQYCPTPHIFEAELLESDMKKDLADLLFNKLNCSYDTVYSLFNIDVRDEVQKREKEKELGYEDVLSVHPTSYNSSGNSDTGQSGRPSGSDNESKMEYDKQYNEGRS